MWGGFVYGRFGNRHHLQDLPEAGDTVGEGIFIFKMILSRARYFTYEMTVRARLKSIGDFLPEKREMVIGIKERLPARALGMTGPERMAPARTGGIKFISRRRSRSSWVEM
jgi:hypothetical protein